MCLEVIFISKASSLHCPNCSIFLVPKSCHYYQLKGATISGNYVVDPDGPGKYPPFTAHCDFNNDTNEGIWFETYFRKYCVHFKIVDCVLCPIYNYPK